MKPKIIFTGGGTAGHVTPNLALIAAVEKEGWQINYIGSYNSVEQQMISNTDIPFFAIRSGKLRRYFSWKNFVDPIFILIGILQSYRLLKKIDADVVFSKGGFVAFPVVFAAWLNKIPVIAHESDLTPGLANRLSFPFVDKICVTFAAAKHHFKHQHRVEITGTPLRRELFDGNKAAGLARCNFTSNKPCILIMGGSQGATNLNLVVRKSLSQLTETYQIIHLCGKGKIDSSLIAHPYYYQFEYANEELPDLFAAADFVISRAGANSLYEILSLKKPHILVPLSSKVSRGDQIQNAQFFSKQGISVVIDDDVLNENMLINAVDELAEHQQEIIAKIDSLHISSATTRILTLLKEQLNVEYREAI